MTPERKRYWVLVLGLIALSLASFGLMALAGGDRVPGGPGGKL